MLEEEFKKAIKQADEEIKKKLNEASEAINEAVKISEKYKVPFTSHVFWVSNAYIPESFMNSNFAKLDPEVISELTGTWSDYEYEYSGWAHSDFCS